MNRKLCNGIILIGLLIYVIIFIILTALEHLPNLFSKLEKIRHLPGRAGTMRNELHFNKVVLEEENIGGEVMEQNAVENKLNDFNTALEVHSNENGFPLMTTFVNNTTSVHRLSSSNNEFHIWEKTYLQESGLWNYRNLSSIEIGQLSNLGRRLFLHENVGKPCDKLFLINVYKYGKFMENRLLKHYTSYLQNPFQKCSVDNCKISYADEDFHKADAVLFHLHRMEKAPSHIYRKTFNQIWVWMSDEGIYNTFTLAKDKILSHYDGLFNWSMTYRSTSDVPVPYGRTVPVVNASNEVVDIFSLKNKTIAIMGSNCGGTNGRWEYVKILMKHMDVDTYGHCGKLNCPGYFNKDCELLNDYKFYLSFENANCAEYITEKAWWNAFAKFSIPVVMGPSKEDCQKLFPPNSYIYAEDYKTPKELAKYLLFLASNKEEYNAFHQWRNRYMVLNEHGYFQSDVFHYCRLCEALNYNSREPKTYTSMEAFWNVRRDCFPPKWLQRV